MLDGYVRRIDATDDPEDLCYEYEDDWKDAMEDAQQKIADSVIQLRKNWVDDAILRPVEANLEEVASYNRSACKIRLGANRMPKVQAIAYYPQFTMNGYATMLTAYVNPEKSTANTWHIVYALDLPLTCNFHASEIDLFSDGSKESLVAAFRHVIDLVTFKNIHDTLFEAGWKWTNEKLPKTFYSDRNGEYDVTILSQKAAEKEVFED